MGSKATRRVKSQIKQHLASSSAAPRNWGLTIDISRLLFPTEENRFIIYWLKLNFEILELNLRETLFYHQGKGGPKKNGGEQYFGSRTVKTSNKEGEKVPQPIREQ